MLKVLYYLPPSVTLKYSHPPHFISCLLIWFSVTSYKTTFPDQICTALCVSLLITEADKLLHSQEMILQSALRQKCKSCQVGSILLWSVRWFLHYLHTTNRVLSLCGDQKGVLFDGVQNWKYSTVSIWMPRTNHFSFIKRCTADNQAWWQEAQNQIVLETHQPILLHKRGRGWYRSDARDYLGRWGNQNIDR